MVVSIRAECLGYGVSVSNGSELSSVDFFIILHAGSDVCGSLEGRVIQKADLVAIWWSERPSPHAETIKSIRLHEYCLKAVLYAEAGRVWSKVARTSIAVLSEGSERCAQGNHRRLPGPHGIVIESNG